MKSVEQYTDDQLYKALRSYGLNIPITPTTRKVCETKLKKFMSQNGQNKQSFHYPEEDSHIDSDFESIRRQNYEIDFTVNESESDNDNAEVTIRDLTHQEREQYRVQKIDRVSYTSIWKYIGLIVILVIFLIFFGQNANNVDEEI